MIYKILNKLRFYKYLLHKYFFLKYLKSNSKKIKCGIKVYGIALPIIKGARNITIGENFRINEYAYLNARGTSEIIIGDSVTISSYAKILTASYDVNRLINGDKEKFEDIHLDKTILLGNNCWVGMGAIVLPGVKIAGENVVIAAGAVVTKSFDKSNVLIAGNPARVVKEYIKK